MKQLAFTLSYRTAYDREHYFVSAGNAAALQMLDAFPNWPNRMLKITGAAGVGKTHLARVFQSQANAVYATANSADWAALRDAAKQQPIIIDAVEALPEAAEEELFHLYNLVLQEGTGMLLCVIDTYAPKLPDLASRLAAMAAVRVDDADDELLVQLLHKGFADRGVEVDYDVLRYAASRMERSAAAAAALVEVLDGQAIALKKPINLTLVRNYFQ